MQRDENLLHINNKLMPFTWVTVRPGRSTPADLVYWMFIQTGRRSDPGFESVLTLDVCDIENHFCERSTENIDHKSCVSNVLHRQIRGMVMEY